MKLMDIISKARMLAAAVAFGLIIACYVERCFISYLLFWHDNRTNQVNVHKN